MAGRFLLVTWERKFQIIKIIAALNSAQIFTLERSFLNDVVLTLL